jgi:septal ring factor EnvC (AmiA/AmiB activator)
MQKITRIVTTFGVTLLMSGSLALIGCSSSPDEEQMKQLNDLKDEVSSLQKDISAKEQQKADLEKQVAEKNAKIKKCNDDQQVVKQRLGTK